MNNLVFFIFKFWLIINQEFTFLTFNNWEIMENIMLTIIIFLLLFILGDNISKVLTNTKDKEAITEGIIALIGIIINILILLGRFNYIKI